MRESVGEISSGSLLKPSTSPDSGFYRALVRACPDAVVVTDLEGTITEVSDKVLALYGGDTVEDFIGKKAVEFIVPEDHDRAAANLRKTLVQGYMDNVTYGLVRKDGTYFAGELNASVIRDKAGAPIAFIATTRDITEREKTDQALRDSEEMYRTLFNGAGDPIFTVEIKDDGLPGNIVEANEMACRHLGFSREELLSKTLEDLDSGENLPEKIRHVRSLLTTGACFFETKVIRKDGTPVPVEVNSHVVSLGAKKVILTVARDISDRKRAEEEIRRADKIESLGTLAGGIAHDFNNFLTGIVGNLSLVLTSRDKGQNDAGYIRTAIDVAMRARALTQQLLTFSVGGAPVMKTGCIADTVADSAEIAMSGSNIKCRLDIAPDTWLVDMDEGQIAQVVSNLVINARQSMQTGGTVRIEVTNDLVNEDRFRKISPGRYVCIRITDHGEGIPPENLQKIFDPYFTTKRSGNGLGLAASLSIVKNHRGHIKVESAVGVGSTFRVYLPASQEEQLAGKTAPTLPGLENRKILVLDDNPSVSEVLEEMLSQLGGDVIVTADAGQALEAASEAMRRGKPFDLAILDLTIPGGVGGLEVFHELKKMDPSIRGIITSGYFTLNIMADFKNHGFSGILRKPYLPKDLYEVLGAVFNDA